MAKKTLIKFDPENARVHTETGKKAIKQSLGQLGAGRSIIIDAEDTMIGGQGVFEEAQALGIPVRIIETDGSELIAVKRKDLHSGDPKRKALAIADNATHDLSYFDQEKLQNTIKAAKEYAQAIIVDQQANAKRAIALAKAAQSEILGNSQDDLPPEIEFTEELLEKHNYVVLFFDNDVDWLQAQSILKLNPVADLSSRPGFTHIGIGRVIKGAKAINLIQQSVINEHGGASEQ